MRLKTSLQVLFFTLIFYSLVTIAYGVWIIEIQHSWLPTWWLDRRFPFNLTIMYGIIMFSWWTFLISTGLTVVGYFFDEERKRPLKLFDKLNIFLFCAWFGLLIWFAWSIYLLRAYDIGDFWVVRIIQNILTGRNPRELPRYDIDVFPTLGDTVIISYIVSFIILYTAAFRAFYQSKMRNVAT